MGMTTEEFLTYKPMVGDQICVVKTTNIIRSTVPSVVLTKVSSVGVKYFTLEAHPSYRFHIDGKKVHKDVNSFPSNYVLYPSKEAYDESIEVLRLIDIIAVATTKGCMDSSSDILKTTIDDLREVCRLLGISTTKAL